MSAAEGRNTGDVSEADGRARETEEKSGIIWQKLNGNIKYDKNANRDSSKESREAKRLKGQVHV